MFHRAVARSRKTVVSPFVCLQCRSNIHTTNSTWFPRSLPANRKTAAPSLAPSRGDRPVSHRGDFQQVSRRTSDRYNSDDPSKSSTGYSRQQRFGSRPPSRRFDDRISDPRGLTSFRDRNAGASSSIAAGSFTYQKGNRDGRNGKSPTERTNSRYSRDINSDAMSPDFGFRQKSGDRAPNGMTTSTSSQRPRNHRNPDRTTSSGFPRRSQDDTSDRRTSSAFPRRSRDNTFDRRPSSGFPRPSRDDISDGRPSTRFSRRTRDETFDKRPSSGFSTRSRGDADGKHSSGFPRRFRDAPSDRKSTSRYPRQSRDGASGPLQSYSIQELAKEKDSKMPNREARRALKWPRPYEVAEAPHASAENSEQTSYLSENSKEGSRIESSNRNLSDYSARDAGTERPPSPSPSGDSRGEIKKQFMRSINARIPYAGRKVQYTSQQTGTTAKPHRLDERRSFSKSEGFTSQARDSSSRHLRLGTDRQSTRGDSRSDHSQSDRRKHFSPLDPLPAAAVEHPIGKSQRKAFRESKKLSGKVELSTRGSDQLSHVNKEIVQKWQNRAPYTKDPNAPTPSSSLAIPRGLAARVLKKSKPRKEKFAASQYATSEELVGESMSSQTSLNSSSSQLPAFTSQTFASYKSTTPPTNAQLAYANRFFNGGAPSFLFSSEKFRELPLSSVPEVVFVGRSNVGKSSLLNALVQRTGTKIANVSSKPGRTRTMNAFGVGGEGGVRWARTSEGQNSLESQEDDVQARDTWVGKGGLVVLDMPGYGKGSRETWGKEITKYLYKRKQLRRTFVLIDSEHGVKATDHQLLSVLRENSVPHQLILTKIDKCIFPNTTKSTTTAPKLLTIANVKLPALIAEILKAVRDKENEEGRGGVKVLEDVICCSSEKEVPGSVGKKVGIDGVRWAVLAACGLDCDEQGRKKIFEAEVAMDDIAPGKACEI